MYGPLQTGRDSTDELSFRGKRMNSREVGGWGWGGVWATEGGRRLQGPKGTEAHSWLFVSWLQNFTGMTKTQWSGSTFLLVGDSPREEEY